MKRMIVKLKDKTKVEQLKKYARIIYTSRFLNTIGIEIDEVDLHQLTQDDNVIEMKESSEGVFQTSTISCL
mgnify:CR=1 FL=1